MERNLRKDVRNKMDAIQVYAILNKRIRGLTSGIRSAVVQGQSIVFTMNDGSTQTMTFPTPADGKDGSSITNVEIRQVGNDYHLFCTITDADGNVTEKVLLEVGGAIPAMSVEKGQWHRLECLESGTVILEMKDGAYEPISPADILSM